MVKRVRGKGECPCHYALFCRLLQMVDESFGRLAKTNVEDIKPDHLPVILVVYKTKGALGIRNIIQGTHALSTFFFSPKTMDYSPWF